MPLRGHESEFWVYAGLMMGVETTTEMGNLDRICECEDSSMERLQQQCRPSLIQGRRIEQLKSGIYSMLLWLSRALCHRDQNQQRKQMSNVFGRQKAMLRSRGQRSRIVQPSELHVTSVNLPLLYRDSDVAQNALKCVHTLLSAQMYYANRSDI